MKALVLGFSLLLSTSAYALHIKTNKIDVTTYKVTAIVGGIDSAMVVSYLMQSSANMKIAGDRIVLINSPGGSVVAGEQIGNAMDLERARGTKMICVVLGAAHSMAFNLLAHCDSRIASDDAVMVAHRIAMSEPSDRMTAKNLREWADHLDSINIKYDTVNAKLLKLTPEEYSKKADQEYSWSAKELLNIGFLTGGLIEIIE